MTLIRRINADKPKLFFDTAQQAATQKDFIGDKRFVLNGSPQGLFISELSSLSLYKKPPTKELHSEKPELHSD
jgi:hypothetical protein